MNLPILKAHREYYAQQAMQSLIDAVIAKDPQAVERIHYVTYRAKKLKRVKNGR